MFGAVQRHAQVRASVIPDSSSATLGGELHRYVLPAATIYADEWNAYVTPGRKYAAHRRIAHKENIYVSGEVHINTIEGFFSLVKNGIRGVYHSVSKKHLQGYLNEYAWRYDNRASARSQFETLLLRAAARSRALADLRDLLEVVEEVAALGDRNFIPRRRPLRRLLLLIGHRPPRVVDARPH